VPLCWELHGITAHPHATHHIVCLCFQAVACISLVAAGGLVRVTAHMGPHNPREAPPCVVPVRGVGMAPPLGSAQG